MKKVINYLFLSFSVMFFASSCLKDTQPIDTDGSHSVVEFGNVSAVLSDESSPYRLYSAALVAPKDTIRIPINYAGAAMAPKDIKVTVELDNSVLDALNKAQFESEDDYYKPLDPSLYELQTSCVIKKGTIHSELLVPVNVAGIDFDAAYAIALNLKDASGETISGNFNKIVINVLPKNQYDGLYTYHTDGYMADRTVTGAALETIAANTVRGNLFYYYSNTIDYTIDPTTNKVTDITISGIGSAVIVESSWDPATKQLHVVYDALGARITDDFTYEGPR